MRLYIWILVVLKEEFVFNKDDKTSCHIFFNIDARNNNRCFEIQTPIISIKNLVLPDNVYFPEGNYCLYFIPGI
jgi:hypothetical protein